MIQPVNIADRLVGPQQPVFVIAEVGVNHNGDLGLAKRLIEEAAQAGADAVKFQAFNAAELITREAPKADYQVQTTGDASSQYQMLQDLQLDAAQQADLKRHCERVGILYVCTPYDHQSVDELERIEVAAYKISSTDTTNTPLLRHIASKGRPAILSTGMSSLGEVELGVTTLRSGGLDGRVILLQCTSEYPAPMADVNLRAMHTLARAFGCPVGFSDHTAGLGASPWAVAVGACVVEKHFTLDRDLPGPDHRASVEPAELASLVKTIRDVELALGDGYKRLMPSEAGNKPRVQKSLVLRCARPAGATITAEDLACKRPGGGLPPADFDRVVGERLAVDVAADTTLHAWHVDWKRDE